MSSTLILARQAYIEALHRHSGFDWGKEAAEMAWRHSKTYHQLTSAPKDQDGLDHLLMLDAPMAFGEFAKAMLVRAATLEQEPGFPPQGAILELFRSVAKLAEMLSIRAQPLPLSRDGIGDG